jgi:hypothetical protein
MIDLSNIEPFAKGGNRSCYQHPENINICLKITHPDLPNQLKAKAPWYKKYRSLDSFDDNKREELAYTQRAISKNESIVWDHLVRWHGFEETSMGLASATEMVLNDGIIAETLESYLFTNGKDEKITVAINDFENWLKKTLILTKNIIPHNIVVKKTEGKLQLKIIDGLGCSSFFPLPKINNFFAKRYVSRRVELMHSRIDWDLSGRKGSWK